MEKGKPTTRHMNGSRYKTMVDTHFAKWRRKCWSRGRIFVVKDYEKFLRSDANIQAEAKAGCDQIPMYPKSSPDLNAIEGWWRRLKMHLEERAPTGTESREAFIKRLRAAVRYLNTHCREQGRVLCRNQKVRARECQKLQGARTRW